MYHIFSFQQHVGGYKALGRGVLSGPKGLLICSASERFEVYSTKRACSLYANV